MSFPVSKTFMVLLLSLIFIGQAMASSLMLYHMVNMAGMKSSERTTIKHYQIVSANVTYNENTDDSTLFNSGCCTHKSDCNVNLCATFAGVVAANINTSIFITFATKIYYSSNLVKSQNITSLYRPPILS